MKKNVTPSGNFHNMSKNEIVKFSDAPDGFPPEFIRFRNNFELLGSPIGDASFCSQFVSNFVKKRIIHSLDSLCLVKNAQTFIICLVARFLSLCLPVIWLPAQVAWLIFQAYQLARGRGEVAAWRENFGSNSKGESHCSFLLRTTWSGVRRCNLILASHIPGQCQRKATRKTVIYAMPCTGNFIRDTVTSGFHKVRTIQ